MSAHKVTSEIFTENDKNSKELPSGSTVTQFIFKCPSYMIKLKSNIRAIKYDQDDDLDIDRNVENILYIEHNVSTELQMVGLQVWRGALLLADYILSNPDLFKGKIIMELGSGVGLTSIVASFLAKEIICTDINLGEILNIVKRNFIRNISYVKCKFYIEELNFLNLKWSQSLEEKINVTDIIIAADVIYDDVITDGFVTTLDKILKKKDSKIAYIALEKRYVFTVANMDTVAPMYEEFLRCIRRQNLNWNIEYVKIDFPRFFKYDRVKHMILMKIQDRK
ncbi:methyltransferase-like protein 22 [Polistes fuscatus]|uniref:methyltransferase-like protein 22 n=1 Tax=Polistes fuscatus TaxID=30207 RepID=UPI001CA941C8|nr:methyltransferase-like protein 22 [Polistes fuscatus]XP_043486623.1 methyltransferase-like protein 22 [Polistes fuscatus]XP_043486624.1 methyltransferase-like protein 22 [Polistes fuscatus]XP_043486625.1 methyltransferase-like protein 22 [Polistes fuscatus]